MYEQRNTEFCIVKDMVPSVINREDPDSCRKLVSVLTCVRYISRTVEQTDKGNTDNRRCCP